MKVKVVDRRKWKGSTRVIAQTSDGSSDGSPRRGVTPLAAGECVVMVSKATDKPTGIRLSLGPADRCCPSILRNAGGSLVGCLRKHDVRRAGVDVPVKLSSEMDVVAFVEGMLLADYRFDRYRSERTKLPAMEVDVLIDKPTAGMKRAINTCERVCSGVLLARDVAHEPPNKINPVTLARRCRQIARDSGLSCQVLEERQMQQLKMGGILAVGQASPTPPRLIILKYQPNKAGKQGKPVVLIGKAVTFDTGGYSIKTRDGMVGQKYDKCGGAAVIGALHAAARIKPKVPVVGIIAAAENMISGDAYRPNDIIQTMSGKTVEIISADAEGRMLLADALTYAQRKLRPRAIIDLATLTGGVTVALGRHAAAIFANDTKLEGQLVESGQQVHERLWPLPMWDDYAEMIQGDDSDIKNSAGREAHCICGAIFLKQFVESDQPWAHLDIASVGDVDRDLPYCPKGATGFGVRLLCNYLHRL